LNVSEGDVALLVVFALFGPLWGGFFYLSYPWLLSPLNGIALILISIGALAGLTTGQHRAGRTAIPAYVWAAIFGVVLVLQQAATAGGLFNTTALASVVVTLVVLLAKERLKVTLVGTAGLLIAFD
jgi:hypothetical protein